MKVGLWSGDEAGLWNRYGPRYAYDMEVTLFPCSDLFIMERMLHVHLGEFHIKSETFLPNWLRPFVEWCCTACVLDNNGGEADRGECRRREAIQRHEAQDQLQSRIAKFVSDCCEPNEAARLTTQQLLAAYHDQTEERVSWQNLAN